MKRLGFDYNKDLSGMGRDKCGKFYKGGYEGVKMKEEAPECLIQTEEEKKQEEEREKREEEEDREFTRECNQRVEEYNKRQMEVFSWKKMVKKSKIIRLISDFLISGISAFYIIYYKIYP